MQSHLTFASAVVLCALTTSSQVFAYCDDWANACNYPILATQAVPETASSAEARASNPAMSRSAARRTPVARTVARPLRQAPLRLAATAPRATARKSTVDPVPQVPVALAFSLEVTPQGLREVMSPHSTCLLERAFNDILMPLQAEADVKPETAFEKRLASSALPLPGGRFRRAQ